VSELLLLLLLLLPHVDHSLSVPELQDHLRCTLQARSVPGVARRIHRIGREHRVEDLRPPHQPRRHPPLAPQPAPSGNVCSKDS
jgi:hypothetical protein